MDFILISQKSCLRQDNDWLQQESIKTQKQKLKNVYLCFNQDCVYQHVLTT